jgi:hypothetical protein
MWGAESYKRKMTGITNAALKFHFPGTVTIEDKTRVGTGDET